MRKNIQILAVHGVKPSVLAAALKTIQGLHFRQPVMRESNYCDVEIINATPAQWKSIMQINYDQM